MSWEWADSWVLMGLGPGPRPLEELIGQMDALNHAIATREELEGGLGRLVAAGLVAVEDDTYRRTQRGQDLVLRASGTTRSWHAAWGKVKAALAAVPVPAPSDGVKLPHSEYERATSAYHASWKTSR